MPITAWKHTEKNRDKDKKSIYYDFMRFGDSSTIAKLLKQCMAFIRAYLDTI